MEMRIEEILQSAVDQKTGKGLYETLVNDLYERGGGMIIDMSSGNIVADKIEQPVAYARNGTRNIAYW